MNATEHLMTCLGEEGVEVAKDCSKALRFGIGDRNFLNPTGPTNLELIVGELNDLKAVVEMLVERGIIPPDWEDSEKKAAKKAKVIDCMKYAQRVGALQGPIVPGGIESRGASEVQNAS